MDNQFGRSQRTATVIACPLIGGQFDCASPETGVQVNRGGVRRLSLDPHKQYQLLAFVANPDPAWACPGLKVGDNELYLAENLVGFAADFPEVATFVIREPSRWTLWWSRSPDDSGDPLTTAGLFV
ncbi:MAG TPA: hypothetical protein VFE86_08810 [Ilumatobacteraceae bacterium]|nr:hypothetical protein [Ilumatobacteraceae bacterium]